MKKEDLAKGYTAKFGASNLPCKGIYYDGSLESAKKVVDFLGTEAFLVTTEGKLLHRDCTAPPSSEARFKVVPPKSVVYFMEATTSLSGHFYATYTTEEPWEEFVVVPATPKYGWANATGYNVIDFLGTTKCKGFADQDVFLVGTPSLYIGELSRHVYQDGSKTLLRIVEANLDDPTTLGKGSVIRRLVHNPGSYSSIHAPGFDVDRVALNLYHEYRERNPTK